MLAAPVTSPAQELHQCARRRRSNRAPLNVGPDGTLYVTDHANVWSVRRVRTNGIIRIRRVYCGN
jgi:hypothetical protein